ncbi:MAG: hypothetical protein M3454_06040 [Actinomycetota bacterium]|nr:hypothetical protein [Actinomycetota bacterium]
MGSVRGALLEEDSPEALEGLGAAASLLEDARVAVDARERAYRPFRERADAEGVARTAAGVANDLLMFRGDPAVAAGWLQWARRGLEDRPRLVRNSLARHSRGGQSGHRAVVKATDVMIGT